MLPAKRAALEGSVAVDDDVCRALGGLRIMATERLRGGDGSFQPSSAQAGGDRPHHGRRSHRADLDERWPNRARALEPLARARRDGRASASGRHAKRASSRWLASSLLRFHGLRHSGESRNPVPKQQLIYWVPAFAGMTGQAMVRMSLSVTGNAAVHRRVRHIPVTTGPSPGARKETTDRNPSDS